MKNDPDLEARLKDIISHGLVGGLGTARPGDLCVEAAICLALGEPHSDRPSCVAGSDRDFAIRLNDSKWSSPAARAEALLPLALAQLGTAGTNRTEWVRRVATGTIRRVLPMALRAAASIHPDAQHREALEAAAVRCEQTPDTDAALAAFDAARAAGRSAHEHEAYSAASACYAASHCADYGCVVDAACAARAADIVINVEPDAVLKVAVEVALEAYAAERA